MPGLAGSSRRLLAGFGTLFFVLPILGTWTTHGVPPVVKALSTAMLLLTAIRPRWGLLAVAAFLPLNPLLQAYLSPEYNAATLAEMLLAPFLLAASLRCTFGLELPPSRLAAPAVVLGAIVAASSVLGLAARQQTTTFPLDYARELVSHLLGEYYDQSAAFDAFHSAAPWIEGLTLLVLAERLLLGQWLSPAPLIAPLAVAITHTWYRLVQISLRREHPIVAAIGFLRAERINTLYKDVNAAGSLLAMFFVAALWMTYAHAIAKTSGPRRIQSIGAYLLATIVIGLPLWMTHSRTAWAGALLATVLIWVYSRRPSWLVFGVAAAATAVVLTMAVLRNSGTEQQSSAAVSLGVRWDMAKIAFGITKQQPWFGVGIGEFRTASRRMVTEELLKRFPAAGSGENAHNNFLQILAELGAVGLTGFVWLLAAAAAAIKGASAFGATRHGQIALAGGILAFLISCLGGHPFLTIETLWMFLLFVGGMAALRAPDASGPSPRLRWIALTAVLIVAASVPVRLWQLRHDDARRTVVGAGPLTDADADRVYRRAGARSSWPVPGHARSVEFSLRLWKDSVSPCLVQVTIDGRPANTIDVRGDVWSPVVLQFDPRPRGSLSRVIDLQVDSATCKLMVSTFSLRE